MAHARHSHQYNRHPTFHIRNLHSSKAQREDVLVSIAPELYDATVTTHPDAALEYVDSDEDTITVGFTNSTCD